MSRRDDEERHDLDLQLECLRGEQQAWEQAVVVLESHAARAFMRRSDAEAVRLRDIAAELFTKAKVAETEWTRRRIERDKLGD